MQSCKKDVCHGEHICSDVDGRGQRLAGCRRWGWTERQVRLRRRAAGLQSSSWTAAINVPLAAGDDDELDVGFDAVLQDFRARHLEKYRQPQTIALITGYAVVFLLSLTGNLLVLVVVLSNKAMRTTTNYFLVNLSVADLLGMSSLFFSKATSNKCKQESHVIAGRTTQHSNHNNLTWINYSESFKFQRSCIWGSPKSRRGAVVYIVYL